MKSTLLCLFLMVSVASANVIFTVSDPFNAGSPDVIGDTQEFDVQQAAFNLGATTGSIALSFNYGPNNTNLNQFQVAGINLNVGDLFFSANGTNYGIALTNHDGIVANTLYQINSVANGELTASQVLGNPGGVIYRPNEFVWMTNATPGAVTAIGDVTVLENLVGGGDGTNNPKFTMNIGLDYSLDSLVASNLNSGPFSIHFAVATCGNDVLDGGSTVPEPSTWAALSMGFVVAFWGLKKSRAKTV